MGNRLLRPNSEFPFAPFNQEQKAYLKQKFQILCNDQKLLCPKKISQQLKTSLQQANRILNYIDFQGKGQVDFYQFMCAAASLHQDDEQAQQFLFDMVKQQNQMTKQSFDSFFGIVFRYLKYMEIIQIQYTQEIGSKKFRQYDFNNNGSISLEQFRAMLSNDYHCKEWMVLLGFAEKNQEERKEKPLNQEIAKDDEDGFQVDQDQGDQAGCCPSWIKTAEYMKPVGDIPKRVHQPNQSLQINYVYGYRSYDTRANLKYNINNQVVYHTAACGIILNKLKNTQKVNTTHTDDITCLDIHVKKNIVATGQMGRKPLIVIWDATSAQTKMIFKNKLQKSIGCIAISPSGRYVAATSMSDNHQIAIYDLNDQSLVAFCPRGPRSVIYQITFNQSQDQLILSCSKQVVFAKFSKDKVELRKGVFGKAPCVPCVGIALNNKGDAIVAMNNGLLSQWKGNSCTKVFKEHVKPVTAITERTDGGVISGDSDGNIFVFSANMSKEKEYDIKKLLGSIKSNNPRIIALCQQYSSILVGTRGGQIIEITKQTAKILIQGHYDEQLWGLVTHSSRAQFFTGGGDKLLYKWDIQKRKPIDKKKFQSPITSLDISRNNILAVGLKNGIVNFYQANTLKPVDKVFKYKNPDKDMISVVRFSPDGSKIAIGYTPPYSQILIYQVNNLKLKPKVCKGSPSRINSIDFSRCGNFIMSNNTSYQILFYDVSSGSLIGSATKFKSQQWSSITSRFCWSTVGIWPPCSDGSDINSVDRSHSKRYLATADDFSLVKVFEYPVNQKSQVYNVYKGHSSHVTGVRWSYDDKFLVSIGGLEKSIIQWANIIGEQVKYQVEDSENQQQQQENQNNQGGQQQNKQGDQQQDQDQIKLQDDQGDQALAIKAYLGQVTNSTPDQYKNISKFKNVKPQQSLQIKHVWGIRNQYIKDCVRNQLRYSADYKSCLFITAALGVEMNLQTKQQQFYQGQAEDLISFDMSLDRAICATGQMAQNNLNAPKNKIVDIHVWDAKTKKIKAKLSGFHQRGIVLVVFSPSGQKLLTAGQDDKTSIAVYDWKNNHAEWTAPINGGKVTGGAWKNQQEYMVVSHKNVKFFKGANGSMGKLNGNGKWDPMSSAIYWKDKDKFVSGGSGGAVYLWSGNVGTPFKNHTGRVQCFSIDKNQTLYSGDAKGTILSWKINGGKLILQRQIYKSQKGILSIDFNPSNDSMLLCTNSSQIIEIKKNNQSQTIMSSHFAGQLWAQSWSPDHKRFVTAGDDKTLRIFNVETYKQEYKVQLKQKSRGLDWDKSEGKFIVVGDYDGRIHLYDDKLEIKCTVDTKFSKMKKNKEPFWIEDIKFSPNGQYVAFGAHGGTSHIQIYEVKQNTLTLKKQLKGLFSSALLSLDWNQSSSIIAAVSQAYQLQFMNLQTKISASSVKCQKWSSWSSKFGFQVKQIHQGVDYSNINGVCVSPSRGLVVTGNDDQKIRLFKYPVIVPKQVCKEYVGHSSHVCKVRFSLDERYLLSVGGNDRTIIVWEVKGSSFGKEKISKKVIEQQQEQNQQEYQGQVDWDQLQVPKAKQTKQSVKQKTKKSQSDSDDGFQVEDQQGDQFMAVKPWIGALKQPTQPYYKGTGKAPKVSLQLQYAHGYRVKDCRNNLKYVSNSNQISYHTAGVCIIMDTTTRQQKFFTNHNDDVISFYKSNSLQQQQPIFYSSQMGAKPIVYSWDKTCKKVKQYKGALKSVSSVCANNKYVVAVGMDDNHTVFLWNTTTQKLLGQQKGGKDVILSMEWINQNQFVSIGIKHYKLWTCDEKTLKSQNGAFGGKCNVLCALAVKGQNIFVGAADGSLQKWSGKGCSSSWKVHKGAIQAVCISEDVIVTGSSDCQIKILKLSDPSVVLNTIKCRQVLKNSVKPSIRALDIYENKILVGTIASEIYQLISNQLISNASQSSKIKQNKKLMSGHYAPNNVTNQVWGLSLYDKSTYTTCSDDGTVRLWDMNKKTQEGCYTLMFDSKLKQLKLTLKEEKEKQLPDSVKGRAICVSEDKYVIIGCKDGTLRIGMIEGDKFKPVYCGLVNKNKKQITHVKFSPDGSKLAVGDRTGHIYIYTWNNGSIKLKHNKIKHNSYIKHFDFSRDSNIIHSVCGAYQLLFWDTQTGKQLTSGATSTRNQIWATWNLSIGWPVQGIFQQFMDGTDINAVDRSNLSYGNKNMRLIVTSDDKGKVRLLEYPCLVKNSDSVKGKGHSSHVTNVKFNYNDQIIFSTGGEDQTVMQWRCEFQG